MKTENNYLLALNELAKRSMKPLSYHNYNHVLDVVQASQRLGNLEGVSRRDLFLLATGSFLHDIVYKIGAKDNEEESAKFSLEYLDKFIYTPTELNSVSELILATKVPTNPKSHLQMIICDADLDNLGRSDFFEKNSALQQEFGVTDTNSWYNGTLLFLESHRYYTDSAKRLRQKGLEENISRLKSLIN